MGVLNYTPLCYAADLCTSIIILANPYSYYSEPLFCSLGIVPFVTALVIGGLILCGNIFSILVIDKVSLRFT